jgi:hypothetical protein
MQVAGHPTHFPALFALEVAHSLRFRVLDSFNRASADTPLNESMSGVTLFPPWHRSLLLTKTMLPALSFPSSAWPTYLLQQRTDIMVKHTLPAYLVDLLCNRSKALG